MSIVYCQICNKKFYVKPSHQRLGWGKYCSIKCRNKSQLKGKLISCLICGKKVYKSPAKMRHSKSGNYFCSKSCQTQWRNSYFIEEKHPNWLGGSESYREIMKRRNVKQICTLCKFEDERALVVHHLDHNRDNNNPSNLVWLCLNCHYLVHHDLNLEENLIKSLHKS